MRKARSAHRSSLPVTSAICSARASIGRMTTSEAKSPRWPARNNADHAGAGLPTGERQSLGRGPGRRRGIWHPPGDGRPIARDLVRAQALGVALGVVVGGGNILRGVAAAGAGLPRATADAMGMLATVVNALVLEAAIERAGASARTMSALAMPQVCETYERQRALRHLAEERIVVFAGGT